MSRAMMSKMPTIVQMIPERGIASPFDVRLPITRSWAVTKPQPLERRVIDVGCRMVDGFRSGAALAGDG